MSSRKRTELTRKLFLDELRDYHLYKELAEHEKDKILKSVLENMIKTEKKHMDLWGEAAGIERTYKKRPSGISLLKLYLYLGARGILGLPFTLTLLSRTELNNLNRYERLTKGTGVSDKDRIRFLSVISDERKNAVKIRSILDKYGGNLGNIRSIMLGLNDGLVEVLAAVSGIAVIANSPLVVALSGIIIGISGTLSMAGGVYISSKSHGLISSDKTESDSSESPNKQALYTGVFYLGGAISVVLPFIFGMSGFEGIAASLIISCAILVFASTAVAILSSTSITKRISETILISLGAVAITVALGALLRFYFGISI
jgi:VIT1/CCC1 family predicted Fe2+/Mn2+ transporter